MRDFDGHTYIVTAGHIGCVSPMYPQAFPFRHVQSFAWQTGDGIALIKRLAYLKAGLTKLFRSMNSERVARIDSLRLSTNPNESQYLGIVSPRTCPFFFPCAGLLCKDQRIGGPGKFRKLSFRLSSV